MKTQKFKRTLSLFLAMLMCVTTLFGMGTTAFAAEETDEVYLISYPRDGDANYGGEWGHNSLSFMNGWSTATSRFTTIRAMGSYEGNICYCIEPGVPQQTGNTFTKKGEDFWDEYPSSYNSTISPDDIKLFIGRIFQYGYTGTISTSWRSQNEGGDKLANAVATQLLIWETVVGERDADFNKVGTGGKSAIVEQISTNHPLYSRIMGYYNSIAASVQRHSKVPSFLAKSAGKAQNIELEWNGEAYTATLADTNGVLSDYVFSANASGIRFSVSGNTLTITADDAPSDTVTITAEKKNSQRRGVITWTDGVYGPNGKLQDTVTYVHYCYLLGIFPKNRPQQNRKRLHFLLREDLLKLDAITAETRLLIGHRIDTAEQLFCYRDEVNRKITALTEKRKQLYKAQRTAAVKSDPEKAAEVKAQITALSKELAALRKEVVLCNSIAERSGVIQEKIKAVREDEQPERKEKCDHVQFR